MTKWTNKTENEFANTISLLIQLGVKYTIDKDKKNTLIINTEEENTHRYSHDLLAALEGLYEHCEMVHKHWGDEDNTKVANAARLAGRAAIAKAKGGA